MVELSDNDKKEVFLADLYFGMIEQGYYDKRKFERIDDVLNRLHEENHRKP